MAGFFHINGMDSRYGRLSVVLVVVYLLSACSYIEAKLAGGDQQRAAISRSVKAEWVKNPEVDAAPLRVRVNGKTILLEGFVESLQESQAAESLARELYPDFKVSNSIRIR